MKRKNDIYIFIFCALVLFAKIICFHALTFGSFPAAQAGLLLTNIRFYLSKLLLPLAISCLLLITKSHLWVSITFIIIDIWCFANIVYFKSYDLFITIDSIGLIANMDGAWSSVLTYVDWSFLFFPITTCLWIIISIYTHISVNKKNQYYITLVILLIITYVTNVLLYDYTDACRVTRLPTGNDYKSETTDGFKLYRLPFCGLALHRLDNRTYVYEQSIVHFLPSTFISFIKEKLHGVPEIRPHDMKIIEQLCNDAPISSIPQTSLIIVLVESLESWVIGKEIDGQMITPFINELVSQDHTLYCSKIVSQTLSGNSGDGQMIVNTGLLPTTTGTACMQYYNNTYPNIAGFYANSAIINPWPHIWNQGVMSKRYGYQNLIEPNDENENWQDNTIFSKTISAISSINEPSCIMAITVSTHSPFTRVTSSRFKANDAPILLKNYMQCVNYTDSCLEQFIYALPTEFVKNATIVITGDHNIFKKGMFNTLQDYSAEHTLNLEQTYCPLIISSPNIEGNVCITDICYQMDIFPTILYAIGCDCYWNGFGINLLEYKTVINRFLSESESYRLSDLIIKNNYFSKYVK